MADGKNDTALGLGERLRSARKARALTLEQAAFTLRLEAPVLRALEEERYDQLGAAVFVRGHLKAYAKLLGLPEEGVMAAYRAADPNADAPPKVTRELEKPLTTTPGPLAIAAVVVLVLVAMLLLYVFSSGPELKAPAQPMQDIQPTMEPAPPVPASPPLEPVTAVAPTDPVAAVTPPAATSDGAVAGPATSGPVAPSSESATAAPPTPAATPAPATPPPSGTFE